MIAAGRDDAGEQAAASRLRAEAIVARLRWLGVILGIAQAFLSEPRPVSPAATVAASLVLAMYNLPLMVVSRFSPRLARRLILAGLVGDFLFCAAILMLFANDEFGTNYVVFALVAIEAAVLYRWNGALAFIAAFVAVQVPYYVERAVWFGFAPQIGSILFRVPIVSLVALMSGGITRAAERSAAEARQQARRAEALALVASRISQTLKRDYVLDTVMDSLANLFPARWHGILLFDPARVLSLEYARGAPRGISLGYTTSPLPEGSRRHVIEDLGLGGLALPEELGGYHAAALLPLRGTERDFGLLLCLDPLRAGFAEDEVRFYEAIADQASTGLENARLYEEVELLSLTDVTTALFNRRALDSRLQEELMRSQRYGLPLTLLMIDVDHFKRYNDVHGHLAGDAVLRRVGDVLAREALRRVDSAFRYGGEEFAVLMPMTAAAQATAVAERIREAVMAAEFAGQETQPGGSVTVSVGLAAFPDHAGTAQELVDAADRALYAAKEAGRNRVEIYDTTPGG